MMILTNVTKGGKELFKTLFSLFTILILCQFFVYMLYVFAYQAHLPLTNFDGFIRFCFLSMSLILTIVFFVLFEIGNKWIASIIVLILAVISAYNSYNFSWNVSEYERIFFITFYFCMGSFVAWLLFVASYRVAANALFRTLFTEEFRSRCDIYREPKYRFLSATWIRKASVWIADNFRNCQHTFFVPLDSLDSLAEFDENSEVTKPYSKDPAFVEKRFGSVVIHLKWLLVSFEFSPQTHFIKQINSEQNEAALFNQNNES